MIKNRLIAGMIAAMSLGVISSSAGSASKDCSNGVKDTRIIVELSKGIGEMSEEEVFKSQDVVLNRISSRLNKNYNLIERYSVLNNAFVIEVNSDDVDLVREVTGVESITYDKIHAKQTLADGNYYSADLSKTRAGLGPTEDVGELEANISAETMKKPAETNDGEGTVIAVLDNEFYFRGKVGAEDAWYHAAFKPLQNGVAQKFTFDNLTAVLKKTAAKRKTGKAAGEEGSLYFNTKVPFYYDYGGDSTSYGKVGPADFDVSTKISYHGSHVASIAAGNADVYKGIAPKAQLACMKVFTEYTASQTGEQLGFGDSSGAYDSAILTAIEDCIKLGVDGINMSLGSDLDDFDGDSLTLKTLSSLAKDNSIMTSISAGNSGKSSFSATGGYANWTKDMVETGILSSYANNTDVMTIASGQPHSVFFETALKVASDGKFDSADEATKSIAYEDQIVNREGLDADYPEDRQFWLKDLAPNGETLEWVYIPGFGTSSDYSGLDVDGKIAIVNRGSTNFSSKYAVAVDNGAKALIIINNDPTAAEFNFRCSFGDDFNPTMPCALILYRDKQYFETRGSGELKLISKELSDNAEKLTMSTFSSDGAKYDYTLKPDITAPGENIRGAVPPQKKEHKADTPYSTYEYLSGTSMSAPNYAGCQSLILSKLTKDIYSGGAPTSDQLEEIKEYRKTIDMRLMSTADPMYEANVNPENGEKNYASPRLQGAGMVDLDGAYNTDVYLEGNSRNKAKVSLRNTEDIANGKVAISFTAHNESTSTRNYNVKLTVMRPALSTNNKVIPAGYNLLGEIDDAKKIPGLKYYDRVYNPSTGEDDIKQLTGTGSAENKDVIKLTKQITYYVTSSDCEKKENAVVLTNGYYYNSGTKSAPVWETLPSFEYQSTQDVVIAEVTGQTVSIPAGKSTVTIDEYEIPQATRADILSHYEYGCAIEGFVQLISTDGHPDLNIPYLGYYSGTDFNSSRTLASVPAIEPFDFEKDPGTMYPSDLVDDVTKSLVGKDNVNMGSSWAAGYCEDTEINLDKVLTNDQSIDQLAGFHNVGTNPATGEYYENPGDNIYVGSPTESNIMIVQQYVMRSIADNYFTVSTKSGKVVYKSALSDSLYSSTKYGKNSLYKTHVEASFLSSGYVGHKAQAVIPLFDVMTNETFEDGEYVLEFNYQLSYDKNWIKKSYNFYIDSTAPTVSKIEKYNDGSEDRFRISLNDHFVSKAELGYYEVDVMKDEKGYYIDDTISFLNDVIDEIGANKDGNTRLYVGMVDSAYGENNAIIHFKNTDLSSYEIAQGHDLKITYDYKISNGKAEWFEIDFEGEEYPIDVSGISVVDNQGNVVATNVATYSNNITVSALACVVTIVAISVTTFIIVSKKRKHGGAK